MNEWMDGWMDGCMKPEKSIDCLFRRALRKSSYVSSTHYVCACVASSPHFMPSGSLHHRLLQDQQTLTGPY